MPSNIYEEDIEQERPPWDEVYMSFALILSSRSTCKRASVGCIVVSSDMNRVLAIGYNGNYKGGPNTCDSDEPGKCGCLHAEANCLIKLDYNDPCRKIMFSTTSPCVQCAKSIINAGIERVVYDEVYRDRAGLDLLVNNNIDVIKIS